MNTRNLNWFKKEIAPQLDNFEIIYKQFDNGDFGDMEQVEFNSEIIGGNIDFWSKGWLGVYLWDFIKEEELINRMLEPSEIQEQEDCLKLLIEKLTS